MSAVLLALLPGQTEALVAALRCRLAARRLRHGDARLASLPPRDHNYLLTRVMIACMTFFSIVFFLPA